MRKIYLKLFVGIIILLWIIYFVQYISRWYKINNYKDEGFTSQIKSYYRPYVRTMSKNYDTFVSNYGSNVIINKLRKWNIY